MFLLQVLEAYALILSSYNARLLPYDLRQDLVCEPPFDNGPPYYPSNCHLLHYSIPLVSQSQLAPHQYANAPMQNVEKKVLCKMVCSQTSSANRPQLPDKFCWHTAFIGRKRLSLKFWAEAQQAGSGHNRKGSAASYLACNNSRKGLVHDILGSRTSADAEHLLLLRSMVATGSQYIIMSLTIPSNSTSTPGHSLQQAKTLASYQKMLTTSM